MPHTTSHKQTPFWQRREQPATVEAHLRHRQIFIIPTQHGFLFGLILAIMLLGSINYNNNMGYMLTFLLGSMAMVSILHTHRMLLNLHITAGKVKPVFVGDTAYFQLWINNTRQPARYALQWQSDQRPRRWHKPSPSIYLDVPANERKAILIPKQAKHRGQLHLGQLMVSCQFPLGLFHAWSFIHIDMQTCVFPKPWGQPTLPQGIVTEKTGEGMAQQRGGDDFIGHRHYQYSDTPRHIDWKAVARRQAWLVKQFGGSGTAALWLRFEQVQHLPQLESALSQLCLWVLVAAQQNLEYGLDLPQQRIELNQGGEHRLACLTALALYGQSQ